MSSARTGLGDPGNRYSRAAPILNPIKRSVNKRRKHNSAIAAPCPAAANGASQTTRTAPLSRSTIANLPAAKKPIRRLSGDQNGSSALSVPLIWWAFDADSARTQSLSFPSGPKATKASRVPSGETEKLLCSKYQLDGGRMDERVGRIDCWPSPAEWRAYIIQPTNTDSTHVAANAAHQRIGTPRAI
jgi:hypothetical protein